MNPAFATAILMLLLLPLASLQAQNLSISPIPLEPYEAIQLAAASPENGVTGVFEFTVRASGQGRSHVYFNSEADYRDQRCLTLSLTRGNAAALIESFGLQGREDLIGKKVRVEGTAKRVRISIAEEGRRTGIYYYQTHVYVDDPGRVRLVEAGG